MEQTDKEYQPRRWLNDVRVVPAKTTPRIDKVMASVRQIARPRTIDLVFVDQNGKLADRSETASGIIPKVDNLESLPQDLDKINVIVIVGSGKINSLNDSLYFNGCKPDNAPTTKSQPGSKSLSLVFEPEGQYSGQRISDFLVKDSDTDQPSLVIPPTIFVKDYFNKEVFEELSQRGAVVQKVVFVSPALHHYPVMEETILGIAEQIVSKGGELELYVRPDEYRRLAEKSLIPKLESIPGAKVSKRLLEIDDPKPISANYEPNESVFRIGFSGR